MVDLRVRGEAGLTELPNNLFANPILGHSSREKGWGCQTNIVRGLSYRKLDQFHQVSSEAGNLSYRKLDQDTPPDGDWRVKKQVEGYAHIQT